MSLISTITGLFSSGGLGKVVDGILDKIPDAGARQKAALEWEKEANQARQALLQANLEEAKIYLQDTANARAMQIAALTQDDKFSKRFVYYIAAGLLLVAFAYLFLVTFGHVPEKNQRMADIGVGGIIGGVISTVISFFFGSTKGSTDKTNQLVHMASQMGSGAPSQTITVENEGTAKTTVKSAGDKQEPEAKK